MKVYPWHAVRYSDGTLPIFCLPGAANLKKADLNDRKGAKTDSSLCTSCTETVHA